MATDAAYEEVLRRLDKLGGKVAEENTGQELDLEIAGQKVGAKGYRLIDLVWLPMVLGIAWLIIMHLAHATDTKAEKDAVAKALIESNATISNALKESNLATVQAIKEMAAEQRKSTDAIREIACLSDPAMKNRSDAREFCKRMSRDSR